MLIHGGQSMLDAGASSDTDLQRYRSTSSDEYDDHSSVPPRDSAPLSNDADSHFDLRSLSRTDSLFSFSRETFSSQLSSLTSMNLPTSESLSASISAISTAPKAVKALGNAAEQIQMWARKAIKILSNLDAEDDIEWAAAAGRQGLDETDKAVRKFETLVGVYVEAIEELQMRSDVGDVEANDLEAVVEQMESTLADWDRVRRSLQTVHDQVELAMEWEELWVTVLGDVGEEMDSLGRLVFEMEERRHMSMREDANADAGDGIDIGELESMLHGGHKRARETAVSRFSLPSGFSSLPLESPTPEKTENDSSLLALFARMQPLRASLDFLPMRLSMFQARAEKIFPTACNELEAKRTKLEKGWKTLEKQAEDLRGELAEDRWVLVFRNAGRQAQKMCDSVERSITKLQEAIDVGMQHVNPPALAKRVESFEAKRMHYGPAIDRVLAIIQKGVNDRLTVNGEILRLHADMTHRVQAMHQSMNIMETTLEEANANQNSELRDSISSIISMDRSMSGSLNETPVSSPASSIVLSGGKQDVAAGNGTRGYRSTSSSRSATGQKRYPSIDHSRRCATPLSSHSTRTLAAHATSPSPAQASVYRQGVYKPPTAPLPRPAPTPLSNKPRWSSSGRPSDTKPGYGVRSANGTTPSPSTRQHHASQSGSSFSSLPSPSPLSREATTSPSIPVQNGTRRSSHLRSFAERAGQLVVADDGLDPLPYHRGRNITAPVPSSPYVGTIRSPSSLAVHNKSKPTMNRPPTSLAHQRSFSKDFPSKAKAPFMTSDHGIEIADDDLDADLEHQLDHPLGSSPSVRAKLVQRPGSVARRRLSMLPLPTGKGKVAPNTGREISVGDRPVFR